ncbi:MAG: SusC/RagA family TonB-linked outer membrane protein [Psychroserpens sp.]|uniref:SusC/RagA family TonB-linked outer membrane protein n=3 Tax=Psychroserpens sp. TaxID=2020870 RepID=UPI003C95309B
MNTKMKFTALIVLLFSFGVFAQNTYTLNGTVKAAVDKMPIPGVNIIVLNTTKGTSTDFDGQFSIAVTQDDILQFSYLGYKTQTVIVTGQTDLVVTLEDDNNALDEVVIVGYGDQKEKNITNALTKVSSEDIEDLSVSRVEDALRGKVAGLRIQTTASEAGGDPKITIRGPGSITGSSAPLIVIDGIVIGTDPDILGSIDNNNVESISVLKDASSVAIYGSRGANGVILITLKEGTPGKTQFSYNTFTGYRFTKINDNFNTSISDERSRLNSLQSTVDAIAPDNPNFDRINGDYNVAYAELEAMEFIASLGGGERNWQEEIFEGGIIENHSFSARGGTDLTSYVASIGYLNDEGVSLEDNFTKYNARIKVDSKSENKKIKFGANLRVNYNDQVRLPSRFTDPIRQYGHLPLYLNEDHLDYITQSDPGDAGAQFENIGVGSYGFSRAFDHVFTVDPNNPRAIARDPVTGLPLVSPLTSGGLTLSTTRNVHPLVHYLERSSTKKQFTMNSAAYFDVKLAKGLTFRQTVSSVFRHTKNNSADFFFGQENREQEAFRNESRDERNQYTFESLLNYNKNFGKHSFKSLLGFEFTQRDFFVQESEAFGYTDDFNNNIALADNGITFTNNASEKLVSYFGRIEYNYDEKYLLQVSARTDGSTRFGTNNRFGFFPAASAGWIISNEEFLSSSNVISFLKFRASYGVSGSNEISNNIYDSLYRFEETFSTIGYTGDPGVKGVTLPNSNLGWERIIEFNPGIDVTFGRGLIDLSLDYYKKKSDDLILFAPVSGVYGVDNWLQNIGALQNEGFEIELNSRLYSSEKVRWSASGQFALNRNEVLDLGGNEQIISRIDQDTRPTEFIAKVGQPITSFYGWVYESEVPLEWIDNPFNRFNNDFARVFVKDLNGDGIIDDEDRTELGNPYPDFTWGFASDLSFYDFDFSVQFEGSHGGEVRVADLDQLYYASESAVNPVSNFPDFDLTVHRRFTDDHIQDASFVTVRNIILGYTFPKDVTENLNISKLRLYVTGENLFYFTAADYEGFNPEAAGQTSSNANTPLTAGYQRGDGPVVRTISAGLNLQF